MTKPELVIFDCDGVLVDSEPMSIAVLVDFLQDAGIAIDEVTAYREFLGRSMANVAGFVARTFGRRIGDDERDAIRAALFARFHRDLKPTRGVEQAIGALRQRRCVASSSQIDRIRLALQLTGLLDWFDPHLYSSSMVENGKPAPDLFLHAARAMGADPRACIVVEDSPVGIEAAKRAGMRVFAYVGGGHAEPSGLKAAAEAACPDLVFDEMAELPSLVARIDAAQTKAP